MKQMSSLWEEEDGFFYDHLRRPDGSACCDPNPHDGGFYPLFAVAAAPAGVIEQFPEFQRATRLVHGASPGSVGQGRSSATHGIRGRGAANVAWRSCIPNNCAVCWRYMLDENEFLSPYGLRGVSKVYGENPFVVDARGVSLGARIMRRASQLTICLAAIPIGAVRFGCPSIISSSKVCSVFHRYFGDEFKVRMSDRFGSNADTGRGSK